MTSKSVPRDKEIKFEKMGNKDCSFFYKPLIKSIGLLFVSGVMFIEAAEANASLHFMGAVTLDFWDDAK